MKGKRLLIIGAAVALAISGCAGIASNIRMNPYRANATMAVGTNCTLVTVNEKDGVKVGTSKADGNMTITVGSGAVSLSLYVAAWNNTSGNISISAPSGVTLSKDSLDIVADSSIQGSATSYTLNNSEATFLHTITLTGVSSEAELTFASGTARRFVVWGASYDIGGSIPDSSEITSSSSEESSSSAESSSEVPVIPLAYPYVLDGTITGGSNGYATESEIEQADASWKATGNTEISPWRIGGKNLTNVDRPIYSETPMDANIGRIEVVSGTSTLSSVNSLTISVHSSAADAASGDNAVATKTVDSDIISSTVVFEKPSSDNWTNKYFRIVYNVSAGGSNSYVQFVSATFYPVLTSISLNASSVEIAAGASYTLTATKTPLGGYGVVTWSSSNTAVATVSQEGLVHGVNAGSTTITAQVTESIKATCDVTVINIEVPATGIALDKTSGILVEGQTISLTATVEPLGTTDVTSWVSSEPTVASISGTGNTVTVNALSFGLTTITATVGSYSAEYSLRVEALNSLSNYVGANIDDTGVLMCKSGKTAIVDDGVGAYWVYASANISSDIDVGDMVRVQGQTVNYSNRGGLEVGNATVTSSDVTQLAPSSLDENFTEAEALGYISDFNDNANNTVPHKRVSLRTGAIEDLGNGFLAWTWPEGSAQFETTISTGGMVAGKIYDVEAYLINFYKNGNITYLCVCVIDATEVQFAPESISLNEQQIKLGVNASTTLEATIAPAGASGLIVWASSNDAVASVDQNGKVTANDLGSATITAFIDADEDGVLDTGELKATCAVVVADPTEGVYSLINVGSTSGYASSSDVTFDDGKIWNIPGNQTLNYGLKIGGSLSDATDRALYSKSSYDYVESIAVSYGTKDSQITINSIKLLVFNSADDAEEGDEDNAVDIVSIDPSTYSDNGYSYFEPTDGNPWENKFFRLVYNLSSSSSSKNYGVVLTMLRLGYQNPGAYLNSTESLASLFADESGEPGSIEVSNVAIRFGLSIPQADWNAINAKWPITDYGVMLFRTSSIENITSPTPVADAYGSRSLANFHKGSGAAPAIQGDNYVFSVKINITSTESNKYSTVFCAAPYIIAGGEIYFLGEMQYSVNSLAQYHQANGGTNLSAEALELLA